MTMKQQFEPGTLPFRIAGNQRTGLLNSHYGLLVNIDEHNLVNKNLGCSFSSQHTFAYGMKIFIATLHSSS